MTIQAQRIRERRQHLGMSQEELAHVVGTSQRQISKYERGENDPTATILEALADALDTSTDWLLGRTNIPDRALRGVGDLEEWEIELLTIVRSKSPEDRKKLLDVAKVI